MSAKPKSRVENFAGLAKLDAAAYEGKTTSVMTSDAYEIRRIWHHDAWWFSVADVVNALAESKGKDRNAYWRKLKERLLKTEGATQLVTDCHELKLPAADKKMRGADCASVATLLRIIQSVPSPRAEPIKQFLAQAGAEKLEAIAQPNERTQSRIQYFRRAGRTDRWIEARMLNLSTRNELTDQWATRGVEGPQHGALTAEMHEEVFGISPADHKRIKELKKSHDTRDHMDPMELTLVTLSEQAATAIMVERGTTEFEDTREASLDGARIAGNAAIEISKKLGRPVANSQNFLPAAVAAPTLPKPKPKGKT